MALICATLRGALTNGPVAPKAIDDDGSDPGILVNRLGLTIAPIPTRILSSKRNTIKGVRLRRRLSDCIGIVVMTGGCCESTWEEDKGFEGDIWLEPTASWYCFAGMGRDDDHPGPLCSGKVVCARSCAGEERICCDVTRGKVESVAGSGDWSYGEGLCGC